jgi:hypothetical protein
VIATLVLPAPPSPEYLALNVRDRIDQCMKTKPTTKRTPKPFNARRARRRLERKQKNHEYDWRKEYTAYEAKAEHVATRAAETHEERRRKIRVGATYQMHCHGAHSMVQVTSLRLIDEKSRAYRVFLRPESFIQLSADPYFCKFALMDHNGVRGFGRIQGVFYEEALKLKVFLQCSVIPDSRLAMLNRDIIFYIVQTFSCLFL